MILHCLLWIRKDTLLLFGFQWMFSTNSRIVSDSNAEGPPVPIPNTEVKLCCGDNTWRDTAREDSSSLTQVDPVGSAEVGIFNAEGPPVPIPNTEVKLCGGDNTCRETDREDSTMPTLCTRRVHFTAGQSFGGICV